MYPHSGTVVPVLGVQGTSAKKNHLLETTLLRTPEKRGPLSQEVAPQDLSKHVLRCCMTRPFGAHPLETLHGFGIAGVKSNFGNGPNTVSESTVSNTEPSEFWPSPSSGERAQ